MAGYLSVSRGRPPSNAAPSCRSLATSRVGALPNRRVYSRLNCDALQVAHLRAPHCPRPVCATTSADSDDVCSESRSCDSIRRCLTYGHVRATTRTERVAPSSPRLPRDSLQRGHGTDSTASPVFTHRYWRASVLPCESRGSRCSRRRSGRRLRTRRLFSKIDSQICAGTLQVRRDCGRQRRNVARRHRIGQFEQRSKVLGFRLQVAVMHGRLLLLRAPPRLVPNSAGSSAPRLRGRRPRGRPCRRPWLGTDRD